MQRTHYRIATLVCLVFALAAVTSAWAVDLRINTIYAPAHIIQRALVRMAKEVNETPGTGMNISVYDSSVLGNEKDSSAAVAMGTLEMAGIGPGELGKRFAKVLVLDSPYNFRDNDHMQKVATSEFGKKLWDETAAATNIRVLACYYLGSRFVTTSKVAVKVPADLDGLKLRVPDQPISIANIAAMGAKPTPMAFGEVYMGLQQGVVDGQENPLSQIMSAKFYEVQPYLSTTGHVTQMVMLIVNEDVYQALSAEDKKLLTDKAIKYAKEASDENIKFEESALEEIKSKGVTVVDADKDAFRKATYPVIQQFAKRWGEGLYEQIQEIQ